MSFTEPEPQLAPEPDRSAARGAQPPARRRGHRRRRAARRLDVALGLLVAIVGIVIAPGYGLVAIIAVLVLIAASVSLLYQRWRARHATRRARRPPRRRRPAR